MPTPDTDTLLGLCEGLFELLKESKREHYHCDDCWYCCRACRHDDHQLVDGEHLGEGCYTWPTASHSYRHNPGVCTCGAAEWNAKVDAALRKFGEG